jgi:hypothetical protein
MSLCCSISVVAFLFFFPQSHTHTLTHKLTHSLASKTGCIFAELLTHEAVFQGENPQNQLELIVSKLGCPPREKLDFVESPAALSQLLRYENRRPPPFQALFPPGSNPEALGVVWVVL